MDGTSSFRVVDTPGLLDTKEVLQLSGPRFDDRMQNADKLLVDSLGPAFLNNLEIVFTATSYSF